MKLIDHGRAGMGRKSYLRNWQIIHKIAFKKYLAPILEFPAVVAATAAAIVISRNDLLGKF